jgi:diaminopimelate decarboxylase
VFGIGAERFSFENTIKRNSEIVRAYRSGVDRFAFDASCEFAESGEPSLNAIIDAFVDDKMKPLEAPSVPQQN